MNGCASYEFLLNEYLDDALDEAQRQQVEAHLAVCPGCRAQARALQGVFRSLAVLPEAPFSADWAELAARLAAEDAVRRMPGWLPLLTAAQGLLAWVLLTAWLLAAWPAGRSTAALYLESARQWFAITWPDMGQIWAGWLHSFEQLSLRSVQAWLSPDLAFSLPGAAWALIIGCALAAWLASVRSLSKNGMMPDRSSYPHNQRRL